MSDEPGQVNPCVRCGACCAFFRVAFYWREAEPRSVAGAVSAAAGEGGLALPEVPPELTVDVDDFHRCMKGTEAKRSRGCVALRGRIGQEVACSIYQKRPSPCRSFKASYEDGKQNKACDEARAAHGLKPLRREDWLGLSPELASPLASANLRKIVNR